MDWLIIIFIIYGIVSKLMGGNAEKNGRSRPGQRSPQSPRQRPVPSPSQAPEPWTTQYPKQTKRPTFDPFDPFDPFSTEDREESAPWPTFPPKQEKEVGFKETATQSSTVESPKKSSSILEKIETENSQKRISVSDKRNLQVDPSPQTLVQGIIWSEILGAPRSKNAHRSVKNRRYS